MSKNKIGEDSPILKFIYLKIRLRDGVESLTTLEEGEFKVHIDGCISNMSEWETNTFLMIVGIMPITWHFIQCKLIQAV